MTLQEKVESMYIPEPNTGCWLWIGATQYGYGVVRAFGKAMRAHRVTFTLFRGEPPPELDHRCRVKSCVNPWHLDPVSHAENMRRVDWTNVENHQRAKALCKRGHEYDYTWGGRRDCRRCRAAASKRCHLAKAH